MSDQFSSHPPIPLPQIRIGQKPCATRPLLRIWGTFGGRGFLTMPHDQPYLEAENKIQQARCLAKQLAVKYY